MANDDIKKFNSSKRPPQESLLSKLERQVDDSIKTQIAINKKKQQEKATALSFYNVNLPATARASSPMPLFQLLKLLLILSLRKFQLTF